MKKKLAILLVGTMIASSILAGCGSKKSEPTKKETSGELKGDITFWHSFTQGPRMEVIQQTADQFMKDNPGVKIKIETFSWGDFYTKWTTGLASGNVPDMSTALPGHVVEMMDADALEPVDDLIDDIGRNKFSKTALSEGKKDGTCYSLPLYSHAQVMWYRIGYEHGPSVQAGLLTSQGIIESMFQDIITNGTDVKKAAKKAENQLNDLFSTVQ